MKKTILCMLLMVSFGMCHAQLIIGLVSHAPNHYKLKTSISKRTDRGAITDENINANTKLNVMSHADKLLEVHEKTADESTTTWVSKSEFNNSIKPYVTAFGGAVTFPFKLRPQSGIIEPNFSLSGVAGIKLAFDQDATKFLGFLVGAGTSSITLNKHNSTDTSGTGSTRAAATFSFTVLGQLDNVQLGLSVGLDNNFDNTDDRWKYQSKPWLSVAIGFNIFSGNNGN